MLEIPKEDLVEIVQLGRGRKTNVVIERLADPDTLSLAQDFLRANDRYKAPEKKKLERILSA